MKLTEEEKELILKRRNEELEEQKKKKLSEAPQRIIDKFESILKSIENNKTLTILLKERCF